MGDLKIIESSTETSDCQIAIIASNYNKHIVEGLINGCVDTLYANGVEPDWITLVKVPGAMEIPVTAKVIAEKAKADVIITLGVIIRGETSHFEVIAHECTNGIARVALDFNIPVIFGVLTVENAEQAMDRSNEDERNKGSEAALTALEMLNVMKRVGS